MFSGLIIQELLKIPGDKIITLALDEADSFSIDISKDGEFGYESGHKSLFIAKLQRAMQKGGGMIIREMLPLRLKRKMPNGKMMWIPEKNLYGVFLGMDQWKGLDAETVRQSHETDHQTGKPLPKEEDVHFRDFPTNN